MSLKASGVGFVGWKFAGCEAVVNNDINRLQLFFDERPDKERCSVLKHKGFHWSPREGHGSGTKRQCHHA
jgi:hypothetical protein